MRRVFLDTNVVLDFLLEREPFQEADQVVCEMSLLRLISWLMRKNLIERCNFTCCYFLTYHLS
ncbi:MAG: PIN domain-containing protein [Dolichospermum sp.]